MSGKLDQSLDEILSTRRQSTRKVPARRVKTRAAPVGGIQKKAAQPATKTGTKGSNAKTTGSDTKIIVSNLVSYAVACHGECRPLTLAASRRDRGPDQGMLNS